MHNQIAQIMDLTTDGTATITCPNRNLRGFGQRLRLLAEANIITVDDPRSWARQAYTVHLVAQTDANWFLINGSLDRWPTLYPEVWDQLRLERTDLDLPTFRQRFHHGVLTAFQKCNEHASILSWMATALNIPCTQPLPPAPADPAAGPAETAIPDAALRGFLSDPGYNARAHHQYNLDTPPTNRKPE